MKGKGGGKVDRGPVFTPRREHFLALLAFTCIALIFFHPLLPRLAGGLPGHHGDPFLNARIISWDASHLFGSPCKLYDLPFFHPSRDVLTYSEPLFTLGLIGVPFHYALGNMSLTYNVVFLLGFVFSAFACYLLVRYLTGSFWGGAAGGLYYAFCPYKIAQLVHIHVIFAPFLPLALLFAYQYLERGHNRRLLLASLAVLAQCLVGWHLAAFSLVTMLLFWLWQAVTTRRRKEAWKRVLRLGAALLVVSSILVLPALPYLQTSRRLPDFSRSVRESVLFAAAPADFLRVPSENLIYGKVLHLGVESFYYNEVCLFPGIIVLLLAAAAFLIARRGGKGSSPRVNQVAAGGERAAPSATGRIGAEEEENTRHLNRMAFFAVLAAVGLVYSLGPRPGGITNPLYYLTFLGGRMNFMRAPSRFYFLVVFGLSVLAGYGTAGLSALAARKSRTGSAGAAVGFILVALLFVETFTPGIPTSEAVRADETTGVYRVLRDEEGGAVVELPSPPLEGVYRPNTYDIAFVPRNLPGYIYRECTSVFRGGYHGKALVNGYSGYFPYFYQRTMVETEGFPSRRSLRLLSGLGVDYVIWHREWVEPEKREEAAERLEAEDELAVVADDGERVLYRLPLLETGGLEQLDLRVASPRAVPAGKGFNLGILIENTCSLPVVSAVEDPQPFRLVYFDGKGTEILQAAGTYRFPLYLDGGEKAAAFLSVGRVPPPGDYDVELSLEGGLLSGNSFRFDLSVRDPEDMFGSGVVSGRITCSEGFFSVPDPGGLFPVVVEVKNTGDDFWRSSWEKEEAEDVPYGLVQVEASWYDAEGRVQVGKGFVELLPCDVSPGQAVEVPLLVWVPSTPGRYRLMIRLTEAGLGPCSDPLVVEVEVGEKAPGGGTQGSKT
jgi:hypothetical protein